MAAATPTPMPTAWSRRNLPRLPLWSPLMLIGVLQLVVLSLVAHSACCCSPPAPLLLRQLFLVVDSAPLLPIRSAGWSALSGLSRTALAKTDPNINQSIAPPHTCTTFLPQFLLLLQPG
ncbi:unnamed protein product [Ectocarpus sp. CCAP 1310/34]|nr:unnamed protein product [Ectocarpus sp. CCAP 1310/34]